MVSGTSGVGPRDHLSQIQRQAARPTRPLPQIPGQSQEATARANHAGQEAMGNYIYLPKSDPFAGVPEKKDVEEMSAQERQELREMGVDIPSEQEIQPRQRSQSLPPERQAEPPRQRANSWQAESEKLGWGKAAQDKPAIKAPDSEWREPAASKPAPPARPLPQPPLNPSGYPTLPKGPNAGRPSPMPQPPPSSSENASSGQYGVMPIFDDAPANVENPSEGQYGVMPHFEEDPVAEGVNHRAALDAIQSSGADPAQKTVQMMALKEEMAREIKQGGQDSDAMKSVMQEIDKQIAQENAKLTGTATPATPETFTRPRSRTSVNFRMSHVFQRVRSHSSPAAMQTSSTSAETPLQGMSRSELARHAEKLKGFDKETAEALKAKIGMIKTLEENQTTRQTKMNHAMERLKNRGKTDLERLEAALKKLEDKEWDSDLNVPRHGNAQPLSEQAAAPPPSEPFQPPPSLATPPPPPPPPRFPPPPKI